jgi:hypothetical protein
MDTSNSTITDMGLLSQMVYLPLGTEPLVDGQLISLSLPRCPW